MIEQNKASQNNKETCKWMCNCCCKIKLIFMGIVALSLTVISLCALARTVCNRHHRGGEHHSKWGREYGEMGHSRGMGGCGMKQRMRMMNCCNGENDEQDGGKYKEEGSHGGEERHAEKK